MNHPACTSHLSVRSVLSSSVSTIPKPNSLSGGIFKGFNRLGKRNNYFLTHSSNHALLALRNSVMVTAGFPSDQGSEEQDLGKT